jgi:glycosyltransferase involved in cell wall biosynthesis
MNRKVALFIPSFGSGGAQRIVIRLAAEFVHFGYKVDLVVARDQGQNKSLLSDAVGLVDLGVPRLRNALLPLSRYLYREKPTALLATMTSTNMVAIAAARLAMTGVRVVVRQDCRLRGRRFYPTMYRLMYRMADHVVGISHGVSKNVIDVARLPPGMVSTIHNPVWLQDVRLAAEEHLEHPWFQGDGLRVILGVGRFTTQKAFDVLIDAFGRFSRDSESRLVILGEGPERGNLEARIQRQDLGDRVWLPGHVENPFKYMKRASVFVLPSRFEGFGNVLLEAMVLGTPVVATDCTYGPAEILENGRWGPLVPVDDCVALMNGIQSVLSGEAPPRDALRARAEHFSPPRAVRAYMAALGLPSAA